MIEQRTPEWFAARRGRVTASLVGAILGVAPYMTRAEAMQSMMGTRQFKGNVATEWGNAHEDEARKEYEDMTGDKVDQAGFYTYEEWLGASPDGLINDDGLLEIKCPYGIRHAPKPVQFKSIHDQPHYFAQVQIQMHVTGRRWCFFFQWTIHDRYLECVEYDPDYIAHILPQLRTFYDEYLANLNADHSRALQLIAEYDDVCARIKQDEDRRKELLDAIVHACDNTERLIGDRKLQKITRAGSVRYADIVKERLPDLDVEPYRGKPSEYWSIK